MVPLIVDSVDNQFFHGIHPVLIVIIMYQLENEIKNREPSVLIDHLR